MIRIVIRFILTFPLLLASVLSAAVTPPGLKPGDTVAIVFPASAPEEPEAEIREAVQKLRKKGFQVKLAPNFRARRGYLAGGDDLRAKSFMDMWKDPEVKALWCWRGGYGTMRMLDKLDYEEMRKHPKMLIGMSDITALHQAIGKKADLVTYLGPNVNGVYGADAPSLPSFSETDFFKTLFTISRPKQGDLLTSFHSEAKALRSGKAQGILTGGNLSLVAALAGTPWQFDTEGKILILEEVSEPPYRVDRLLSQLKLAGMLDRPAAVILASFNGCQAKFPARSLTLGQVLKDYFGNAPYPVLLGFPSGHIADQATLPLNTLVELDADKKTLRVAE